MASLTLQVGPITSTVPADDAVAANILRLYIAAYDGPVDGTNQQQADFVVGHLRRHIVEVARGQNRRDKESEANAEATEENEAVDW